MLQLCFSHLRAFMPHFQNLQNILAMDFTQMRALTAPGGKRASDEAITTFVSNFIEFYAQFTQRPNQEDLLTYQQYMQDITAKINESEYTYYLEKYTAEFPEEAEGLACATRLSSFRDIPKRMQYWAASEEFGGTIRNSTQHREVVRKFGDWIAFIDKLEQNDFTFFQKEKPASKREPLSIRVMNI
jgi:hypothetical protein